MKPPVIRMRQRGQAMVEFIVAALFFLVPMFLAIVVLGKFSDVQHTSNMAARYAAWERTVWYDDTGTKFGTINAANHKTTPQIANEISMRLINNRASAVTVIKNTDRNATSFANGTDPMWKDNEGKAYLDDYTQKTAAITRETPNTDIVGGAVNLITSLPLPSAVTGTIAPPVSNDTLAVATFSLNKMAQNSQAYRRLWPKSTVWVADWTGVDFAATGAILSNTWYANGSGSTKLMVEEMVPMAKGLGDVVGAAANISRLTWDPLSPAVDFGKVAPDVVPADRLR